MKKESFKITEQSLKDEMSQPDQYDVVMTPDAIPDLGEMSKHILDLIEFIETDKMKEIESIFLNEYKLANKIEDSITEKKELLDKLEMNSEESTELYKTTQTTYLESKKNIIKLRKSADKKKEEYENIIYGKFNSFLPMKIISLLVEQERYNNLTELLDMFETLKDIKAGKKDINIEAEKFGEHNRSKYVYPKFGGKDNFIQEMSNPKNQQDKQNKLKKKSFVKSNKK